MLRRCESFKEQKLDLYLFHIIGQSENNFVLFLLILVLGLQNPYFVLPLKNTFYDDGLKDLDF